MTEEKYDKIVSLDGEGSENQGTIMVPLDDLDTVSSDSPDTVDELAMELATIHQSSKKIAVIGSRNLAITHQQIIETLVTALAMQGNTIITSTKYDEDGVPYNTQSNGAFYEIGQDEVFEGAEVALRIVCKDGVVYPQALRVYKNGEPFNPFEGFDE